MMDIINTFNNMYNFFTFSKTQGSYLVIFLMSIFLLYRLNKEENIYFGIYATLIFVLVVANPVVIYLLGRKFPVFNDYKQIIVLIPVLLYIPLGAVELLNNIPDLRKRNFIAIILVLFISICGNIAGFFRGETMTAEYRYDKEKVYVVDLIEKEKPNLVLACDSISPFLGNASASIPMLYGPDLWMSNLDTGIMDRYDDGIYYLHNMMQSPVENMKEIVTLGKEYGCDIIVVDNYNGTVVYPGYRIIQKTGNYIVYRQR